MKIGTYIEDQNIIEKIIEEDFKDLTEEELTEEMEMLQFKLGKLQLAMSNTGSVEDSVNFLNGMIKLTALTQKFMDMEEK